MSKDHEQELYWIEAYWRWMWDRMRMEAEAESEAKREAHDEKFFEKRINRINEGPPPKGKPKSQLQEPDPANTISKELETEALHRAISIRPR